MKKYDSYPCRVASVKQLTRDVFDFQVQFPQPFDIHPGQFAQIRLPGHTLRRPISICSFQPDGFVRFVFQIRGQGTEELAAYKAGQTLEVLAPLGNGFPVDKTKRTLLIGGGIGVPPLLGCAEALGQNAVACLGFRNKDAVILEEDFQSARAKTLIATDDGSYGHHGLVTELAGGEDFDMVFACGPTPMLRAAKSLAESRGVPCFLSLEERMACGIGACLGCATPLLKEDGSQYFGHVCKDGPVFDSRRVVL